MTASSQRSGRRCLSRPLRAPGHGGAHLTGASGRSGRARPSCSVRDGRSDEALAAYGEHGRVVLGPSSECVRARLVADWWAAQRCGGDNVMVAMRRADVRELNERARALRVAAGDVVGAALRLPTGEFAAGDRVVTTRNRRSLGVHNGSRGTVTAVDKHLRTATVYLDGHGRDQPGDGQCCPAEYLDGGHLAHGYAITGHKAQGMTAERAFVLGDETMCREWGYVRSREGEARTASTWSPGTWSRVMTAASAHPASPSESLTMRMAQSALMKSSEQRLALHQFEAASGPPSAAIPPPPPPPPRELDDEQLRAAASAAREAFSRPKSRTSRSRRSSTRRAPSPS